MKTSTDLLHLDDPERLGERERRQWLMLTAQLCGTGKRWRLLSDALAMLWQASAWRDELRQLLALLAKRSGRRLHPLHWALPMPLHVHGRCNSAEIESKRTTPPGSTAKASSGTNPARPTCCS